MRGSVRADRGQKVLVCVHGPAGKDSHGGRPPLAPPPPHLQHKSSIEIFQDLLHGLPLFPHKNLLLLSSFTLCSGRSGRSVHELLKVK